ncbi:MAG: response regulator transcription factor [Coriobacteriia bacterium]|nr:response regulator transcription factor [Coriobacteriia bacterium]
MTESTAHNSYTILIVDDDVDILNALEIYLKQEDYNIVRASNGQEALNIVKNHEVHLVLLDVMMPVLDGIQTAVALRETSNVPIVFLSAKAEDTDRILGLNMGGDDYITKPFNPVELLARIKATLRRYARLGGMDASLALLSSKEPLAESVQSPQSARAIYQTGDLVLDDKQKLVTVADEEVKLTALEYKILKLLMSHMGHVFSAAQIYESVWNEPAFEVSKTVSVHIRRIREKIEVNPKEPQYLKMLYGLGYKVVKKQ